MTNLRLPGQYDERLFAAAGISGLQGPYYNWNRWYLPSVGRYLELDPIAMAGGFNGPWGPDWYGYASEDPLSNTDHDGTRALADACENATADARATAAQVEAQKNFADSCGFLDPGHKKKARNAQKGLKDALRRIKKFCPNPDTPEIKKWEDLANWDSDSPPDHRSLMEILDLLPLFRLPFIQVPLFVPMPIPA